MADTNLNMVRGTTKTFQFAFERNNEPIDITNARIVFTVLAGLNAVSPLIQKILPADDMDGSADGITITDGPNGQCDIKFLDTETQAIYAPNALPWDVKLTESNGTVSVPDYGVLYLIRDYENPAQPA